MLNLVQADQERSNMASLNMQYLKLENSDLELVFFKLQDHFMKMLPISNTE